MFAVIIIFKRNVYFSRFILKKKRTINKVLLSGILINNLIINVSSTEKLPYYSSLLNTLSWEP